MATSPLRQLLPRLLNLLLWLSLCALGGTGLLLAWRLPPGSRGGRGLSAWGLDRHGWGDLHTWLGVAFLVLTVLHLALHWRWLWQFASKKRPLALWIGLGAGVVLFLLLWLAPVQKKERDEHSRCSPAPEKIIAAADPSNGPRYGEPDRLRPFFS